MAGVVGPRQWQDRVYKTVVANRAEYALPDSFLRINHPLRLIDPDASSSSTSSFPLKFLTKDEYDQWEPNPNADTPSSGTPWGYTIWKNCIYLVALPDKAYQIEINLGGEHTELVADDDQTIFSEAWDETIAAGALKRLFGMLSQFDRSQYWQGVYLVGSVGDQGALVGGLKLLRQLERDNTQATLIVKNNSL